MKQKAARNKTIDFSLEEGHEYLERCILAENGDQLKTALQDGSTMTPDALYDQYIIGDTFQVMKELPPNFVDLLIVDPPYNLAKDYHGNKFNAVGREEYREYTIKWVQEVLPLLKKTASIYVCCDWRSSLIIGDVLQEYFLVQNRITWQREKGRGAKSNWKNGMEDIWFATVSRDYTFHLDEVKVRKRVLAPYRVDGNPKDWEETDEGRFRNTCPSNFWDDISIPYWSMPENTAHPTQKPEKLLAKLLLASSSKGDVLLRDQAQRLSWQRNLGESLLQLNRIRCMGHGRKNGWKWLRQMHRFKAMKTVFFGSVTPEDKKRGRKYPCPLSYKIQRLFFRLH